MVQNITVPGLGVVPFPDGMSKPDMEAAILEKLQRNQVTAAERTTDAVKSFGVGAGESVIGLAGLPGDMPGIGQAVENWGRRRLGYEPNNVDPKTLPGPAGFAARNLPGFADIKGAIEKVTGPFYEPKTKAGEVSRSAGALAPYMVMGPGGALRGGAATMGGRSLGSRIVAKGEDALRRVTPTVGGAVGAELGQEAAQGTDWEVPALLAGALLGARVGAGPVGSAPKLAAKGAPTLDALSAETNATYTKLRQMGVKYDPVTYNQTMQGLQARFEDGLRAGSPRAGNMLDAWTKMDPAKLTWNNLEEMRKQVGKLGKSLDASDRNAAGVLRRELDKFTTTAPFVGPASLNPAEVNATTAKARELASRNIKAQQIEMEADLGGTFVSGADSGTRNRMAALERQLIKERGRGWTPTEREAVSNAAGGTVGGNTLSALGKAGLDLGPKGNIAALLPALTAAAGATYAGGGLNAVLGGTAVLTATSAAKIAGRKVEENLAKRAIATAAAGRKAQEKARAVIEMRKRGVGTARRAVLLATPGLLSGSEKN